MTLTPARQRNAVSEGAALGLLLCARADLPFDKMKVDLAFAGAWRDWTYRDRFPQVNTDLAHGGAYLTLIHAQKTRQVWAMFWVNMGDRLVINTRDPDWSVDNPADVEYALTMIGGDVPRDGWVSFAESFLSRFDS